MKRHAALIYGVAPIALLSLCGGSAFGQELQLCVQQPIGFTVAVTVPQTCDDLPGSWVEFDIDDNDWSGAGTGALHTSNEGDQVGIGTSAPNASLHIVGEDDGTDVLIRDDRTARIRMVATDPQNNVALTVQARGSDNAQRAEIGTTSNHGMVLFTNGTNRIIVGADGQVCIGNC